MKLNTVLLQLTFGALLTIAGLLIPNTFFLIGGLIIFGPINTITIWVSKKWLTRLPQTINEICGFMSMIKCFGYMAALLAVILIMMQQGVALVYGLELCAMLGLFVTELELFRMFSLNQRERIRQFEQV